MTRTRPFRGGLPLGDGRVQVITFKHFDGAGKAIVAELVESKDGKELRRETTAGNQSKRMGQANESRGSGFSPIRLPTFFCKQIYESEPNPETHAAPVLWRVRGLRHRCG